MPMLAMLAARPGGLPQPSTRFPGSPALQMAIAPSSLTTADGVPLP